MTRPFDRYLEPITNTKEKVIRPSTCPECGSRAIGTLAKVTTADTCWRCAACGAAWNRQQRQPQWSDR